MKSVVPGLRVAAAALALVAAAGGHADAGDPDPALRQWIPPRDEVRRGPPVALEMERRMRGANSFGPRLMRPQDRALIEAAREGRWDEAKALVESGQAGADTLDERGAHALWLAAGAGRDDLVTALARRGAVLDRPGADGLTPMGAAAWHGHRSTVRLLLRLGADVRIFSRNGHTALHLAALAGHVEIVDDLLARGVPIELLNRARESALDVAAFAMQDATMDLLIQGGADLTMAGRR
jgi:hypothetical protein